MDFMPRFGARIDLAYAYGSDDFTGSHADALTYLAGPILYLSRREQTDFLLHGMVGGTRVAGTILFPSGGFISGYVNKLSWAFGGSTEHRLSPSFGFRTEVDYLHTAFFDQSGRIHGQNNIRILGTVVYHFRI